MIDVLYFSDREVKQKLVARATGATKLTVVTVLPPHRAVERPQGLEPFATLERDFGHTVDLVLVVDEGKIEGMWRDPVVDLADALHPSDAKAAYAAARGYFFVQGGVPKATVKKTNDPEADLDALEKTIERLTLKRRPGAARPPPKPKAPKENEQASRTAEDEVPLPAFDPYELLGIARGTPLDEARKAWRALIVLYHPDKVAHLAPEFRDLAEEKTRQLMTAWEQVEAELTGSGS